jgi:hypothetical protein
MPQTINIDLRLTSQQRTQIGNALTTLESMVNSDKYRLLAAYWDQMDTDTRQTIIAKAPLLARLLAVAKQLPRNAI